MGLPSGWPWQLGTIIWAALAVLGQCACACVCKILTPSYSVCFVLPLVFSPPLVIPPPERQSNARICMHSLYGKMRPHMVHIMWFEWSYRWQMHPECLQTCSRSSKSENVPKHIEKFQPRMFDNSNKTPPIFQKVKMSEFTLSHARLLEASYDSATCLCIKTAKLPCLHSSYFLWRYLLALRKHQKNPLKLQSCQVLTTCRRAKYAAAQGSQIRSFS